MRGKYVTRGRDKGKKIGKRSNREREGKVRDEMKELKSKREKVQIRRGEK